MNRQSEKFMSAMTGGRRVYQVAFTDGTIKTIFATRVSYSDGLFRFLERHPSDEKDILHTMIPGDQVKIISLLDDLDNDGSGGAGGGAA